MLSPDDELEVKVMDIDPVMLAQLAEARRQGGYYVQAVEYFRQVLAARPRYAWAWAHLGATWAAVGVSASSGSGDATLSGEAAFNMAIELQPGYAWAYAQRGDLRRLKYKRSIQTGDLDADKLYADALADFTKAIELTGGEGRSLYAWAFAHRGATHRLKVATYYFEPGKVPAHSQAWELGVRDFKRACTLSCIDPGKGETDEWQAMETSVYAWSLAYLATMYMIKREYRHAFKYLLLANERDPSVVLHSNKKMAQQQLYSSTTAITEDEKRTCLSQALLFAEQAWFLSGGNDAEALYIVSVATALLNQQWSVNSASKGWCGAVHDGAFSPFLESAASALCSVAGLHNQRGEVEKANSYLRQAAEIDKFYVHERYVHDPGLSGLTPPTR